MADILERIDAAIERITSGHAPMRVPAEETDPDLVLSDCREQISELRTALFRERASVPPVGERERLEKELLRRFAPANLSAHAAEAPCISCGYNGAGYWQSGTHHPGCVVRDIGGLDERIAAYRAILSSPAPDPASGPRASIELGSCKDDDDCYTFIVALANTEEDENRDEEAPILYSGEYPTEADRDEAASRVAAALGLQVKESR